LPENPGKTGSEKKASQQFQELIHSLHREIIRELDAGLFRDGAADRDGEAKLKDEIQRLSLEYLEKEPVMISRVERESIISQVMDEVLGYGPISPFLAQEDVSEIMINGPHQIYVEKKGKIVLTPTRFRDDEQRRLKEGSENEYESYTETETLNSMVPIWRRHKSELTDADYYYFYREKFFDFEDPLRVIHSSTEGKATYNALLFVPGRTPFDYYSKEYEKGLQLYSNGVLIMEKCADLLPDHFSFIKGLVDSQDLSLNISREMLQHDRQLKIIAQSLERKIKSELLSMLNNERETYEKFYNSFGLQLKWGIYNNFGANKELLKPLLMFYSSLDKKLVTIEEYIGRMKEDQKYIYYACGKNVDSVDRLPQTELVKDKGFEILYLVDDIDEFALKMLHEYDGKEFKSVSSGDLGLETEEEKQSAQQQAEDYKELFAFMKEALDGKAQEVRLSQRLKSHPVCLTSDGALSLEMEKVLNAMPSEHRVCAITALPDRH
jgi:molecular chaperone HtpG